MASNPALKILGIYEADGRIAMIRLATPSGNVRTVYIDQRETARLLSQLAEIVSQRIKEAVDDGQ